MSGNEKKVPKRRFKEFENEEGWEQRKVGAIASSTYGGGTPATANEGYWNGSIPWIQSSDLIENEVSGVIPRKHISECGLRKSATKLVPENSIAIITRVGVGKLAFMQFPYTTSQDFLSLSKLNIDPWFGVYSCYKKLQSELHEVQGTSIKGITKDELLEKSISVPCTNEQKQIGKFFKNIDNIINLNQRKLEKMKALKKAYLTDMFPTEGERKPKLRFSGFTDDWEQREVKDIFEVTRGYVLAATETTDKKTDEIPYPVYSSQTKDNGLMGYYKDFLYENAITWTTDGANAGTLNYRTGKFYCTNVCGVLLSDEGYANKMVSEAINNISWKHVSKVGNPKLMNNVMSKIVVSLPKTIEEQNTISDFLNRLDNLIAIHQHKLKKLKNIKKAYLNEMFI